MSTLTIAQAKVEIRSFFGNRTDLDDRLDSIINMSQMRIARLYDFDELRDIITINTTVTVDAAVDKIISLVPLGNYRKIYSIRLFAATSRARKLKKINPKRWDEVVPEAEFYSRGAPTHYVIWGRLRMELSRVPDAVYPMYFRYSRWPTIITSDTPASNLLDLSCDDAVIHLASSYIAMTTGNLEKSNQFYSIYAAIMKDTLQEEVEDFDTHIANHGSEVSSIGSVGTNDPFVRSMEEM